MGINGNIDYHIECSVLNSIMDNENYLNEPYFKIDHRCFLNPFNQLIAKRVGEAIENGESVSLIALKLEDWISTQEKYQQNWIDIISQQPLSMITAKRYYEDIKRKYIVRLQGELVK
jgi:replicative DNA helicase